MKTALLSVILTPILFSPLIAQRPPRRPPPPRYDLPAMGSENQVKISQDGEFRYIESNGLPDHKPGQFPNRNNPNDIQPQQHRFRMPLKPEVGEESTPIGMAPFGIALDGIPLDPSAAEWWEMNPRSGWQYKAMDGVINLGLDSSNAHVQPTGAYHYHGLPKALVAKLGGQQTMVLIGYAGDGFPIYNQFGFTDPDNAKSPAKRVSSSYRLRSGTRPSGPKGKFDGSFVEDFRYVEGSGDLDECNGRFGVTPEYPDGIYHYYITDEFPFIPRRFRGTPDESFRRRGPRRGGPPGRPPGRPPVQRELGEWLKYGGCKSSLYLCFPKGPSRK